MKAMHCLWSPDSGVSSRTAVAAVHSAPSTMRGAARAHRMTRQAHEAVQLAVALSYVEPSLQHTPPSNPPFEPQTFAPPAEK